MAGSSPAMTTWDQFLLQQHARGAVLRQQLEPAAAAVEADGGAALRLAVGLEPFDEMQPLRAVVAAAGDNGAERLAVRVGELGGGGRLDLLAVPGEPKECMAVAHGMLDLRVAREPPLLHRRLDQRCHVRPELVRLRRIDANQLTGHSHDALSILMLRRARSARLEAWPRLKRVHARLRRAMAVLRDAAFGDSSGRGPEAAQPSAT